MTTTSSSPDVLIIGGGLAGLSAALHLAERGLKPLVVETDPQYCGGRLAGGDAVEFQQNGQTWRFRLEHGVHGFWSPYRNLQAMLARHNLRPVFVPVREEAWTFMSDHDIARHVDRVNALGADLVVLTGDITDGLDHAPRTFRALSGLSARAGVVAILGNHDVGTGAEAVKKALAPYTDFTVLDDEVHVVEHDGERLWIIGLMDRGAALGPGASTLPYARAPLRDHPGCIPAGGPLPPA